MTSCIWVMQVVGDLGLTNVTFLPEPESTNILANTGVIHHIDGVMYDKTHPITAPTSTPTPTFAPFAAAAGAPVVVGAPVPRIAIPQRLGMTHQLLTPHRTVLATLHNLVFCFAIVLMRACFVV